MKVLSLVFLLLFCLVPGVVTAKGIVPHYEKHEHGLEHEQYAKFPQPLSLYKGEDGLGMWETIKARATWHNGFNLVVTIIFICAILHTFLAGYFVEIAHRHEEAHKLRIEKEKRRAEDKPHHDARDDVSFRAHLFHFLGEVETVFGLWVLALCGAILWYFGVLGDGLMAGVEQAKYYLGHDVNYTEPIFVVIIMAVASTRPIVRFSEHIVDVVARIFGGSAAAWWLSALTITPILGSFITEPAAMTIAAILLAKKIFEKNPPKSFCYATLGLLFVNISVGGTLTHFAAPPVLMVAGTWNWDTAFMLTNFGWKAIIGILVANTVYFFMFRKAFAQIEEASDPHDMHMPLNWDERTDPIPHWVTAIHLFFLAWTVFTNHFPALFIGGFLFLLAFTQATGHHQNDVSMRSPLLVGFFLGGLVIHGGLQAWWIEPLLTSIDNQGILMAGSTLLTAINDNAAITYLASQAQGLSPMAKYAIVAGAVAGGGLTVIANAPNPAGKSLLGRFFDKGVSPGHLFLYAIIPTLVVIACFVLLPSPGMHEERSVAKVEEHAGH